MQEIYRSIGDSMAGENRARLSVYVNQQQVIASSPINTSVPMNQGGYLGGFLGRQGHSLVAEKGGTVGERMPDRIDVIQKIARHPHNPFGLIGFSTYSVTEQDMMDLMRFSANGRVTIWDAELVALVERYLPSEPDSLPPIVSPPTNPPPTTKPAEPTPDFGPAYKRLRQGFAAARGKLGQLPAKGGGTWLLLLRDLKVVLDGSADAAAELEPK